MALLVATLVAFLVLEPPWRWLLIAGGVAIEAGEAFLTLRYGRRRRPVAGPEAMVGALGTVVSPCRPDGSVRVAGELWHARCAAGADAGARVRVLAVDGLTLLVEPAPDAISSG